MPTDADHGLLSGYDESLITPSEAFAHRTVTMNKLSAGIWSVTGEEITQQDLTYASSPTETAPSHMHVDFHRFEAKQIKAKATMLAELASQRGRRHP